MDHVPATTSGLIFSKINLKSKFNQEEEKVKQLIKGKKNKSTSLKKALHVAEKNQQRIKLLKQAGLEDKANQLSQKSNWNVALKRAEGVKIKDDVKLIKKTMKKVHKKKEKSSKQWQERKEQIERRQQARQAKRQRNIKARTQSKIQRKVKSIRKRKGRA